MSKKKSGVYICTQALMCEINGKRVSVPTHAIVPRDVGYEVMEGREGCFEEIVESATAAPGEKRAVTMPTKAKADKPKPKPKEDDK